MRNLIRGPRFALLIAATVAVAGCSGIMPFDADGPAVTAPVYAPGDRWVYRAQDGFMTPVAWEETHEVVAAGNDGISVRVTQRGPNVNTVRTEQLAGPGRVRVGALFDEETRRFEQELKRYDFPLVPGKRWNQWIGNFNEQTKKSGEINRYVTVGGWRRITTPAGAFDAIALRVYMHLDDEEFWRDRTDCTYLLWYAPAVRAVVREEKEAQYREKSGKNDTAAIRSQHALIELIAYSPAAR